MRFPWPRSSRCGARATLSRGLVGALLLIPLFSGSGEAQPITRPNILLIVLEDVGSQLGALGTPGLSTPNIDRLADEGVIFTQAFTETPSCSPSKAAIYTGLHAHRNGLTANAANAYKPAAELSTGERNFYLYETQRVRDRRPTLIERLRDAGYRTMVTNKLHVAPNERFPYDVWSSPMVNPDDQEVQAFIEQSQRNGDPWLVWYNINTTHRPFLEATVDPAAVEVPPHLPQTSDVVRNDWAGYLTSIQAADDAVRRALNNLEATGTSDAIVVLVSDHGPAYHRAKYSPYDLGLRVPLIVKGPALEILEGALRDEVVGTIDLLPTLLELAQIPAPPGLDGASLVPLLRGEAGANGHEYLVSSVYHRRRGDVRDLVDLDGRPYGFAIHDSSELSIYDGRLRLIFRPDPAAPHDFPDDLFSLSRWDNPVYGEIRDNFQGTAYHDWLARIDNGQSYGLVPPQIELYDSAVDLGEIDDLAAVPGHEAALNRLMVALQLWAIQTRHGEVDLFGDATRQGGVADNFDGGRGALGDDPNWTSALANAQGEGFSFGDDHVDAAPGPHLVALHDGLRRGPGQGFQVSVRTDFNAGGVGAGVVFGWLSADEYLEFLLLDGRTDTSPTGRDILLRRVVGGQSFPVLFRRDLPDIQEGPYTLTVRYVADTLGLDLQVLAPDGSAYFQDSVSLAASVPPDSAFGIGALSSAASDFDDFHARTFGPGVEGGLGDMNGDGVLDTLDIDSMVAGFGASTPENAAFNLSRPDEVVDLADVAVWLRRIHGAIEGRPSEFGDLNLNGVVDASDLAKLDANSGMQDVGYAGGDIDGNGVVDEVDRAILLQFISP